MAERKDNLTGAYRRPDRHEHLSVDFKVSGGLTVRHVIMPPPPDKTLRVVFTATMGGFTVKGQSPMAYTLPVGMQVNVVVQYVDSKGNPAKVDGETEWSSSDESIAIAHVNADDSTHCIIMSADIGQAQITCRADADLSDGTREIMGTLDIEVVPGEAVSVQIVPQGAPEPIPVERSSRSR